MIARTMFGRLGGLVVTVVALAAAANTEITESPPADSTAQQQPINEPDERKSEGELNLKTLDKELFKRLFAKRRKEHLGAIKNLQRMDSYERQYKLISMLTEKMFDVIESKKVLLENFTESDLASTSFAPQSDSNTDTVDAISNVLENIALLGDVVLNLPDITERVLRKQQPKWNETIRWSFEFLNRSRDLLDESTLEMAKLALQELNIGKREASYFNPNRIAPPKAAKKAQKKQRRKKGPTITRVEL